MTEDYAKEEYDKTVSKKKAYEYIEKAKAHEDVYKAYEKYNVYGDPIEEKTSEPEEERALTPPILVGFRHMRNDSPPITYMTTNHPLYDPSLDASPSVTVEYCDSMKEDENYIIVERYYEDQHCMGSMFFKKDECDSFFFRQDFVEPKVEPSGKTVSEDIDTPDLME